MGPEEVDEWERMGNFLLFYVQLVRVLPLIFNFQFSFFFSRPTGTLELSENLFGTLQSARGKKIGKIVVLPWIWKELFQMEWGSDCYEPSENI